MAEREKIVVRLSSPDETLTFYDTQEASAKEGLFIIRESGVISTFPLHRIRDIITTLEDSE